MILKTFFSLLLPAVSLNMLKSLAFRVRALSFLVAGLSLLSAPLAQARDGVAFEYGHGNHTDMGRVAYTRDWSEPLYETGSLSLGGYWDASLGFWNPHSTDGNNHQVTDIGLTPVFRITQKVRSTLAPYAEAAVGAHLLSTHSIYNKRNMSSNYQFGDHVALGVSFGDQLQWDVAARLQHLSNAGIINPNPGINFYQVRVDYHF
jgi:lipid A 3-O-deacylase